MNSIDFDKYSTEQLEKKAGKYRKKYFPYFEKNSRYLGDGVYQLAGNYSTDTRRLLLMFIVNQEGIKL